MRRRRRRSTTCASLAHGIYPAILAEAGLGPALATLAAGAPIPVELAEVADERLPAAVESAAYVVVVGGGRRRGRRGTPRSSRVTARRTADRLVIDVHDDGQARDAGLVHVADRVGALGGTARSSAPTDVRAEIPCA